MYILHKKLGLGIHNRNALAFISLQHWLVHGLTYDSYTSKKCIHLQILQNFWTKNSIHQLINTYGEIALCKVHTNSLRKQLLIVCTYTYSRRMLLFLNVQIQLLLLDIKDSNLKPNTEDIKMLFIF